MSRPHQRDHESNQQIATAIRPQLPRDGSAGMTKWKTGELPKAAIAPLLILPKVLSAQS